MKAARLKAALLCIGALTNALFGVADLAMAQTPPPERAPVRVARHKIDPLAPSGPQAAKAFAVLDRHCARCHDVRRLKRGLPAAGIANILDLEATAHRRDLIRPGHPEGSTLYVTMLTRHMPYDVFQALEPGEEPSLAEIAKVRDWIAGLPKTTTCQAVTINDQATAAIVEQARQASDREAAPGRRYLSLNGLLSNCDSPEVHGAYRQAATKLINLLSRSAEPVRLESVGEHGLLLSFDLADIGWSVEQWGWLAQRSPGSFSAHAGDGSQTKPHETHVLPAAWLAHQAMDPSVYARLVALPATLPEMFKAFQVDEQSKKSAQTYRLDDSLVTRTARTLMRRLTPDHFPLWTAQDYAGKRDEKSPSTALKLLQTRVIAQLPNGLPLFALFHRDGTPRASVHASASPDAVAQAGAAGAGLRCLACHGGGLNGFQASSASEKATPGGWQARRDNSEFYYTLRAAGVQPLLRIDGQEPVVALAARYSRDLGLNQAAAELGLSPASLSKALFKVDGSMRPPAHRLLQGLVTRVEFEALKRHLAGASDIATVVSEPFRMVQPDTRLRLSLWTGKSEYAKGDELTLYAAATTPCRLTLISVDATGDAIVVFPSEYQDDNLIEPRRPRAIPTPASGFRLRVDQPGREVIVGICLAGDRKSPPGILHDHELQPFTLLGDWDDHTAHALEADTAERRNAGKRVKRRRRRRGRRVKRPPFRATKLPLPQDWAMILIPGPTSASVSKEAQPSVSRESNP